MNENLKDLKQEAERLSANNSLHELITVRTKIIDLEQEPHAKALAYVNRGIAYGKNGEYDEAIADFTKALELEPNNMSAYCNRGLAYLEKGVPDQAIANFTKALELEPNNIFAYRNRGLAYLYKYDPDKAIEDFTKILDEQHHDDAEAAGAYLLRGFAYILKRDYDKAIADYSKALEFRLNNENAHLFDAIAHRERGFAYIKNGNFLDAFKDFVEANFAEANKDDQVPKSKVPEIYFADKIAGIYKERAEEEGAKVFELYFRLLEAISEIQEKQFYAPRENTEVAHYTSLHTLKSLAADGRFRLYNADYMNDPEEGRVFFEIMGEPGKDVKKFFYGDEDQPYPSPAYIGSFVKVDEREAGKDKLFLWRLYGNHDGQEAAGTCLIFKHEGTVFAEKCGGVMQHLQFQFDAKSLISAGTPSSPGERQPPKPDLYEIVYSDEGNKKKLSEELNELATSLKQIKLHIEEEKDDENNEKLRKLVRDLLDTIRFLFKSRHYREEGEVRVIQIRYSNGENTKQDDDGIQVDTKQIPPRFYLETHKNFRFSEVILGPQARGEYEWKRWLKERGVKAEQSNISYGKPYP